MEEEKERVQRAPSATQRNAQVASYKDIRIQISEKKERAVVKLRCAVVVKGLRVFENNEGVETEEKVLGWERACG